MGLNSSLCKEICALMACIMRCQQDTEIGSSVGTLKVKGGGQMLRNELADWETNDCSNHGPLFRFILGWIHDFSSLEYGISDVLFDLVVVSGIWEININLVLRN